MDPEIHRFRETLPALKAYEGLFSRMNAQVILQDVFTSETLPALRARE